MAEELQEVGAPKGRSGRWLRRLLVALLVLQTVYLVVANWALRSDWLQDLIRQKSRRAQITWSSASTWFPGQAHVEGFKLWRRGRKSTWRLEVETASLRVALLPLLWKRVQLHGIEGQGYGFWLHRENAEGLMAEAQPEVPPIFGDGPSEEVLPKRRRPSGWAFEISEASFRRPRELWLGAYRIDGEIAVDGGFSYITGGELEVYPCRLRMQQGRFELADHAVAEGLDMTLDISFSPFSPRQHRGKDSLSFASGRLQVDGQIGGLGLLNEYLAAHPWLRMETTGGHLMGDLGFVAGFVTDQSSLRITDVPLALSFYGGLARGKAEILADVQPEHGKLQYRIEVQLRDAEAGAPDGETIARIPKFDLVASDEAFHLVHGFKDPALDIDLPNAEFPDLAFLETHLPPTAGVKIRRGRGSVKLKVGAAAKAVWGKLQVSGEDMVVDYQGQPITAKATFDAALKGGDLQKGEFALRDATLRLVSPNRWRGEAASKKPPDEEPWVGLVELADSSLRVVDPWSLRGELEMELTDTAPFFVFFLSDHRLLKHFRKALTVRDIRGTAELSTGRQNLALRNISLDGEKLQFLGQLDLTESPLDGLLWAKFHGISAALEVQAGQRDLKLIRPRRWYDGRVDGWWARNGLPGSPSP